MPGTAAREKLSTRARLRAAVAVSAAANEKLRRSLQDRPGVTPPTPLHADERGKKVGKQREGTGGGGETRWGGT